MTVRVLQRVCPLQKVAAACCLIIFALSCALYTFVRIGTARNLVNTQGLKNSMIAFLISQSQRSTAALSPVEKKCPMYQEFRHLDFLHPATRHRLCRNAEAYKLYPDGFPMCLLPSPFDKDMLSVVRDGSEVYELWDIKRSPIQLFVYKGDDLISSVIRQTHGWEPELVNWTLGFALKLPQVTFLDIGSNIGVYSIQAAKLGLPVVSLDANIRNLLRLRLSLNAASLDAALVWNFIAPDQKLKYLSFLSDCNVGGAGKDKADLPDTVPVMPLRSERLGSLIKTKNVVMKMDVQGGEADFLQTSGRLFTDFNVAAVQMEWQSSMMHGNDSLVLRKFLTGRGYGVWQIPGLYPLDPDNPGSWETFMDVIWIHPSYLHLI